MAADNFQQCLAITLKYEGGDVHHSKDPGGRTRQGITQATYDAWRKRQGLAQRTVFAMTVTERDAIYRREFWDKVGGDDLPLGVDLCIWDLGVNSGPARANKYWTAAKAQKGSVAQINHICNARMTFLKGLNTWPHFGTGWTRRVESCRKHALAMAKEPQA